MHFQSKPKVWALLVLSMSKIKRNGITVMLEYNKNIRRNSDMATKRDRKILLGKRTDSKSRRDFLNLIPSVKEQNGNTKKKKRNFIKQEKI